MGDGKGDVDAAEVIVLGMEGVDCCCCCCWESGLDCDCDCDWAACFERERHDAADVQRRHLVIDQC